MGSGARAKKQAAENGRRLCDCGGEVVSNALFSSRTSSSSLGWEMVNSSAARCAGDCFPCAEWRPPLRETGWDRAFCNPFGIRFSYNHHNTYSFKLRTGIWKITPRGILCAIPFLLYRL